MRKKILIILGIIVFGISTFTAGHYMGNIQGSSTNVAKFPVISSCIHMVDNNMLRFMVSGGESAQEAAAATSTLNKCWEFVNDLPNHFSWGKSKRNGANQLIMLVQGYGDLVIEILNRETKLNTLFILSTDEETSVSRANIAKLSIDVMVEKQMADVERSKIFLRSIDTKLVELW